MKLFSQSVFNPPADSPSLIAACPTIDLTAAVGGGNTVYIRRRGGEIVSKLTERNKEVDAIAWKSDGRPFFSSPFFIHLYERPKAMCLKTPCPCIF